MLSAPLSDKADWVRGLPGQTCLSRHQFYARERSGLDSKYGVKQEQGRRFVRSGRRCRDFDEKGHEQVNVEALCGQSR
jgi:hypothetical protein